MSVGKTAGQIKNKTDKKDEDVDEVDIYMSVFFDGTNNNRDNIDTYRDYKKNNHPIKAKMFGIRHGSAKEEYSNVARYSKISRVDESNKKKMYSFVYVDGIGTSTGMMDSKIPGKSFGTGRNGVNAKVSKGCRLVCDEINRLSKSFSKKSRVRLHCSATGFSRGAAAARRFVSCIEKEQGTTSTPYRVCLKSHLDNVGVKVQSVDDIDVLFLGLFDTVSSYGMIKTIKAESDNVNDLALDKIYDAKKIVQLCAGDEYRLHFSLTTVKESGNSKNYIIPGAHSDVGGGYVDPKIEKFEIVRFDREKDAYPLYTGFKPKNELLNEGWFNAEQRKAGKREIPNSYSFIPYCYMRDNFIKNVDKKIFDRNVEKRFEYGEKTIDKYEILKKFYNDVMAEKAFYRFEGKRMSAYIPKSEKEIADIKELRSKFLHLSANTSVGNDPTDDKIRIIVKG